MKKIRINELARELEVKAHEILDKLPELGVQEKKTHSSSIDDDVADKLRVAFGHEPLGPSEETAETDVHEPAETPAFETSGAAPAAEPKAAAPAAPAPDRAEPPAAVEDRTPGDTSARPSLPIRPP